MESKRQYRINGFEQINRFFDMVFNPDCHLGSQHISLYLFLLYLNNKLNWSEWFNCSYEIARTGSGIGSNHTYYRTLHGLEELGLIKYQAGNKSTKAAMIHIIKLCNNAHINAHINAQLSAQISAQFIAQLNAQFPAHIYSIIINKLIIIITNNIVSIKENQDFDFKIVFKKKTKDTSIKSQDLNKKNEAPGAKSDELLVMPFSSDEFMFAWNNFLDMRIKIKKPVNTLNAKQLILKKITKLSGNEEKKAVALLNQSTEKEWMGIFPLEDLTLKNNNNGRTNKPKPGFNESVKSMFTKIDAMYSNK
jgi:hypothetical protein